MSFDDFLVQTLDQSYIIAFGESYHGAHTVVFQELVKHLDGFTGLLLEDPVSRQFSVDHYLKTGEFDGEFKRLFEAALTKENKDIKAGLKVLLDGCREHSLQVICVDSSKTKMGDYQTKSETGYYFLRGNSRDEDMFNNIMDYYQKHPGKWLFIGGAAHVKSGMHYRAGETTLGELLKQKIGNKFCGIYLWKLGEGQEIECFDVGANTVDPKLIHLLKQNNAGLFNEHNNLIYEGYIIHS